MSATPEQILLKHWKYNHFRPGQIEIIQSILNQQDVLALLPTGGGKSICFQVPALILGGLTLVVSPLIALMKDQVDGLKDKGISAVYIHSGQTWSEIKLIMENALKGHYQLFYVSPERLTFKNFEGYLINLNKSACPVLPDITCLYVGLVVFPPEYPELTSLTPFKFS